MESQRPNDYTPQSRHRASLYPIALYFSGIAGLSLLNSPRPNFGSRKLMLRPEALMQAAQQRGHRGIKRGVLQLKLSCEGHGAIGGVSQLKNRLSQLNGPLSMECNCNERGRQREAKQHLHLLNEIPRGYCVM